MKIVYCISGMFKSGGIERVIANKANYWTGQGHEVYIITTDQRDRPYFFDLDPRVKTIDLELNYDYFDSLPSYQRLIKTQRLQGIHRERLTKVLSDLHADFVVSVWRHEASFLPDIKDGSKKILELHTSKYAKIRMYPKERRIHRLFGRIRVWFDERIARRYDHLVILTQEELPLWNRLSNVSVIPNMRTFGSESVSPLSEKVVIAVGRYEYVKNFEELIQIWSLVSPSHPDWQLHIYGDGWLRDKLQEQIRRLGLEEQVLLKQSTTDIRSAYIGASIYALSSHFEGLPMVLLEAQAVGLPIVSYACQSGPKDIITDGVDGYLAPLYNRELFADRLISLMEDSQLRLKMGQKARIQSERFSDTVVMQAWEQLFAELNKS